MALIGPEALAIELHNCGTVYFSKVVGHKKNPTTKKDSGSLFFVWGSFMEADGNEAVPLVFT